MSPSKNKNARLGQRAFSTAPCPFTAIVKSFDVAVKEDS